MTGLVIFNLLTWIQLQLWTPSFNVAAHEFGHSSLGLSHPPIDGALMYKKIENGFEYELPQDDKLVMQTLHGAKTTTPTTKTTAAAKTRTPSATRPYRPYNPRYSNDRHPYTPHRNDGKSGWNPRNPDIKKTNYPRTHRPYIPGRRYPDRTTPIPVSTPHGVPGRTNDNNYKKSRSEGPPNTCDTNYDSVALIRKEVFFFKDAYFWRIREPGVLMPGYPAKITRLWQDFPRNFTHVDAVYERPDTKIVFFIDDNYYVFTGNRLDRGYPRPLTDLGLPKTLKKIDGAMIWGYNGKSYYYSGSMYWRFDEKEQKVELDYPRDMSMWQGVGTDIDAVFQWRDGKMYFFKGKGFWKFDDIYMRVQHEQQKPSGPFWMGCSNN